MGPAPHLEADENQTGPLLLSPDIAPSEDLTWMARRFASRASPFDGSPIYDQLFNNLARALHRRQRPHGLLVGERGVGKSLVIAELACRAAHSRLGRLAQKRFLAVDCRHIPADEARPRLQAILAHSSPHPDLVICLDGLHGLLAPNGGAHRAILFGALSRARCHLLAALTPQEFDDLAIAEPEFAEFFTRIELKEPDFETALRIVEHFSRGLAERYGIVLEADAIRQSVILTSHYILNDHLPAKALKVLTQACDDGDFESHQLGCSKPRISSDDVVRVVSQKTGIPENSLRGVGDRIDYAQTLGESIFGQPHAIKEVASELGLIKAGMTDRTKPASVMLFLGQTGTGKTELAKTLARFYSTSKRLKTYTLGNCVEPHSVATIIGVPPGYVGSERGGRLVNDLNADPYGVFLLDEADKAHPDVLQPFLNLFDEGWVVDQRGSKGFAARSIFILTTNVGQRMLADMHRDGKSIAEITSRMKEALSQIRHGKSDRPVFTPEFLARIKRVIVFQPLDRQAMEGIVGKRLTELNRQWTNERGKQLSFPDGLTGYIGGAAHRLDSTSGGKEGGRIVPKLIADWIETPLQKALADQPRLYHEANAVIVNWIVPTLLPDQPYRDPEVSITFQ